MTDLRSEYLRRWAIAHPNGAERRRFNRVVDLLTPISHVPDKDTYEDGVMAALEALGGRIHTGFDDQGEPTYLEFSDDRSSAALEG